MLTKIQCLVQARRQSAALLQLSVRGQATKDDNSAKAAQQGDEEFSVSRLNNRKKGLQRKTKDSSVASQDVKLYNSKGSASAMQKQDEDDFSDSELMTSKPKRQIKPTALEMILTPEYLETLEGLPQEEVEARLGYKLQGVKNASIEQMISPMAGVIDSLEDPENAGVKLRPSDIVSLEDYHTFKKEVRSYRKDTLNTLMQYKHSHQLLEALDQKLGNKDPETRAYLSNKLEQSGSKYNQVILKSLKDKQAHKQNMDKNAERAAIEAENSFQVHDSFSSQEGKKRMYGKEKYAPLNKIDVSEYQKNRSYMTAAQYNQMKLEQATDKQTIKQKNWRDYYDIPTEVDMQIKDLPSYELSEDGLLQIDVSGVKTMRRMKQLYEENQLKARGIDLEKLGGMTGYERQIMRDHQASVNTRGGNEFDQPSMDLKRDRHYEIDAKLRSDIHYFDDEARQRTETWEKVMRHENREQMAGIAEMNYPKEKQVISDDLKKRIDQEYLEFRELHAENWQMRDRLAYDFKACREVFQQLQQDRLELINKARSRIEEEFGHNVHSAVLGQLEKLDQQEAKSSKPKKQAKEFDPETTSAADFEAELLQVSEMAQQASKEDLESYLYRFEFLFNQMNTKNVQMGADVHARLFEYALLNGQPDLANNMLRQLTESGVGENPIAQSQLENFLNLCLKRDNFDGVALLTNYCEANRVPIGDWNISRFRSAINHYLNVDFNLSKVMIFSKFYRLYYSARAMSILGDQKDTTLDSKSLKKASNAIFGPHEHLVDMKNLFNYLVDHIGKEQIVDPSTRQDCLWSLIELFTQDPHFFIASQYSESNGLETEHIAKYLCNQAGKSQTLSKTLKVAMRLDECDSFGVSFVDHMLKQLRAYQNQNSGRLPAAFNKEALQQMYLKLRAANKIDDKPSSELLLFLLNQSGLHEEVLDFCLHEHLKDSQIKEYYQSEALLNIAPKKVIPSGSAKDLSTCAITQATKAMFLESTPDQAMKFFNSKVAEINKKCEARQNALVDFYDQMFGAGAKDLTIDEFKSLYKRSQLKANRVAKEVFAVNQLERIISGKDYEQIEQLLAYYTTLQEQRQLEQDMHKWQLADRMNEYKKRMQDVTSRQNDIAGSLGDDEVIDRLEQLDSVLGAQQIRELSQSSGGKQLDLIKMFSDVSHADLKELDQAASQDLLDDSDDSDTDHDEEANAVIPKFIRDGFKMEDLGIEEENLFKEKQNEPIYLQKLENEYYNKPVIDEFTKFGGAPYQVELPEEQTAVFEDFYETVKKTMDAYLEINGDKIGQPSRVLMEGVLDNRILETYNFAKKIDKARKNQFNKKLVQNTYKQLDNFEEQVINNPNDYFDDLNDPEFLISTTYDDTMLTMKESLLSAINERKKNVLGITFDLFSKIQNQKLNMRDIEHFDEVSHKSEQIEDVQGNMETIKHLIDDSRSPILSLLIDTEAYNEPIAMSIDQQYPDDKSYENPIDIDRFKQEQRRLKEANGQIAKLHDSLMAMKLKVFNEKCDLEESGFKKGPNMDRTFEPHQDARIKKLFDSYKHVDNLDKSQKVEFMKKALQLQMGEKFTSTDFPVFYALDLVSFGVNKKVPEAIRLGEQLLAQQKARMPQDLQRAVRDFMLDSSNQKRYREGIKFSDLQNTSHIYNSAADTNDYQRQAIYSYDDPFWMEWMAKNSRRVDNWRTPSMHAFTHKPHGLLGEVVNMDNLRQKQEQLSKYM